MLYKSEMLHAGGYELGWLTEDLDERCGTCGSVVRIYGYEDATEAEVECDCALASTLW